MQGAPAHLSLSVVQSSSVAIVSCTPGAHYVMLLCLSHNGAMPYRREALQRSMLELLGEGTIFVNPAPPLSGTLGAALVAAATRNYMKGLSFTDY